MEEKIDLFEFYMEKAEHASELSNQLHNISLGLPDNDMSAIVTLEEAVQVLLDFDTHLKAKAFQAKVAQMKGDTGV